MTDYCTIADVKVLTGHKEDDFGLVDPGAFEKWIDSLIVQASRSVDRATNNTFDIEDADEVLAPILASITSRMVLKNMLLGIQSRTSPVEKIDEFALRMIPAAVSDEEIRKDIKLLPHRPKFSGLVITGEDDD